MMLTVGVPAGRQTTQSVGGGKLGEDQCHKMLPALERFVVGIAGVTINDRFKLAPVNGFKQLAKNARRKAHASFPF